MPSPFPGMDPWLEHGDLFPDFRCRWLVALADAINSQKDDRYYAAVQSSEVEAATQSPVLAEGLIQRSRADESDEAVVVRAPRRRPSSLHVDLICREHGGRLATRFEVLEPWSKTGIGRRSHRRMQQSLFRSEIHLVEFDFLREGLHATAVPKEWAVARTKGYDYHISVRRYHKPEDFLVYPIRFGRRLPTMELPLLPGHGGVKLALQPLFDQCYDRGRFRDRAGYDVRPASPSLDATTADWAAECLRNAGVAAA